MELGTEDLDVDVILKPGMPFQIAGDSQMTFMLQPAGAKKGSFCVLPVDCQLICVILQSATSAALGSVVWEKVCELVVVLCSGLYKA
jgi:hypothetical protein